MNTLGAFVFGAFIHGASVRKAFVLGLISIHPPAFTDAIAFSPSGVFSVVKFPSNLLTGMLFPFSYFVPIKFC